MQPLRKWPPSDDLNEATFFTQWPRKFCLLIELQEIILIILTVGRKLQMKPWVLARFMWVIPGGKEFFCPSWFHVAKCFRYQVEKSPWQVWLRQHAWQSGVYVAYAILGRGSLLSQESTLLAQLLSRQAGKKRFSSWRNQSICAQELLQDTWPVITVKPGLYVIELYVFLGYTWLFLGPNPPP